MQVIKTTKIQKKGALHKCLLGVLAVNTVYFFAQNSGVNLKAII